MAPRSRVRKEVEDILCLNGSFPILIHAHLHLSNASVPCFYPLPPPLFSTRQPKYCFYNTKWMMQLLPTTFQCLPRMPKIKLHANFSPQTFMTHLLLPLLGPATLACSSCGLSRLSPLPASLCPDVCMAGLASSRPPPKSLLRGLP